MIFERNEYLSPVQKSLILFGISNSQTSIFRNSAIWHKTLIGG